MKNKAMTAALVAGLLIPAVLAAFPAGAKAQSTNALEQAQADLETEFKNDKVIAQQKADAAKAAQALKDAEKKAADDEKALKLEIVKVCALAKGEEVVSTEKAANESSHSDRSLGSGYPGHPMHAIHDVVVTYARTTQQVCRMVVDNWPAMRPAGVNPHTETCECVVRTDNDDR